MSLRSKIVLLLSLVMAGYVGTDFAIQRLIVSRGFDNLEQDQAELDAQRIVEALRKEISDLHHQCLDWSASDSLVRFVNLGDGPFAEQRLRPSVLTRNRIDLLFICEEAGRVRWHRAVDPDTGEEVSLRDFPAERWDSSHPFLAKLGEKGAPNGLLLTEHKPMLVSSRPILSSDEKGPSRGTLVLGRFLSSDLESLLSRRTKVSFDFWQLDGRHQLPEPEETLRDELTSSVRPMVRPNGDRNLAVYAIFNDIRGRPDFLIRANVQRKITDTGETSVRYAVISTIVAGLILLGVLLTLLRKTVLKPIADLTSHAVRTGQSENFRAKLNLQRPDEIGVLSREFDKMMEKLEHARAALVDTARTAGKSEVAMGILHNVGNVLNSVNISATLVSKKLGELSVNELEDLAAVLDNQARDLARFVSEDPRGKLLRPYVRGLANQLRDERASLVEELRSLSDGITHIRELIRSQQDSAVHVDLLEPIALAAILDQALRLTEPSSAEGAAPQVVRRLPELPDLLVDRHRLLEILVNLMRNARQAMAETAEPRLTLGAERTPEGRLRISVADNGVGIAPENLTKIFGSGFTTKKNGQGLGLHSAANAVKLLDGTLSVLSEGPGHGATFVLDLPWTPVPAAAAATG